MIRLATILWPLAVMIAGYAMFQVKYEVSQLEDRLAQLNHDIAAAREEIRVLNAEWSLLYRSAAARPLTKRLPSPGADRHGADRQHRRISRSGRAAAAPRRCSPRRRRQ